jgi:hypothetical protein
MKAMAYIKKSCCDDMSPRSSSRHGLMSPEDQRTGEGV